MTTTRKPKAKREMIKTAYRLLPAIKYGVSRTSDVAHRSENAQVEYLLKLGLLAIAGIEPTKLTAGQITDKFDELYGNSEPVIQITTLM